MKRFLNPLFLLPLMVGVVAVGFLSIWSAAADPLEEDGYEGPNDNSSDSSSDDLNGGVASFVD